MKKIMLFLPGLLWKYPIITYFLFTMSFLALTGLMYIASYPSVNPWIVVLVGICIEIFVSAVLFLIIFTIDYREITYKNIIKRAKKILKNPQFQLNYSDKLLKYLIKQAKKDDGKTSDLKIWLDKFARYKSLEKKQQRIEEKQDKITFKSAENTAKINLLEIELFTTN